MRNNMRKGLMVAMIALLAGCNGGSGSGPFDTPPKVGDITSRLDREDAMRDRVEDYAGTSWSAIPDTGSANFAGVGTARIDRNGGGRSDDVNLVGFVRLDANFKKGTIDGTMTDIQGYTGRNPSASNVFDTNGRIEIGGRSSELERVNVGATNRWNTDYRGTLTSPEGDITMRGTLDGIFRGTQVSQSGTSATIRGLTGRDNDGRASVDGRDARGLVFEVTGLN